MKSATSSEPPVVQFRACKAECQGSKTCLRLKQSCLQVALYCSEGEEDRLVEYLETAKDALGKPLYDPQAALQLSRQYHLDRASIELLWQLHLFEVAPCDWQNPIHT